MGTVKVLSLSNVVRITGVSGKQYKKITWHTSQIIIKQLLTMDEYLQTVRNILNDCSAPSEDGTPDNGVALELIDFAIRANIISAYAFVELPTDVKSLYYTVYESDLYDTVCANINKAQLKSIKDSIMLYVQGGFYE